MFGGGMGTKLRRKRIQQAFSQVPEKEFLQTDSGRGLGKLPKKKDKAKVGEFKPRILTELNASPSTTTTIPKRIHPIEARIQQNGALIVKTLQRRNGFLPLGDHSAPQAIYAEFQLSKHAFKQAIGHLWKQRKIDILPGEGIRLKGMAGRSSPKGTKTRNKVAR
jgi:hypothetical protein